jgi:hypothetical protein
MVIICTASPVRSAIQPKFQKQTAMQPFYVLVGLSLGSLAPEASRDLACFSIFDPNFLPFGLKLSLFRNNSH